MVQLICITMAQILIISNRLPISVQKENGTLSYSTSVGGLSNGLASYVNSRRNHWIGWPGIASDDLSEQDKIDITHYLARRNCVPVFLTKKQVENFYNGYSNSILWPLFHNLPFNNHDPLLSRWWRDYKAVNRVYLEVIGAMIQPGSSIWVHDYQLLLLPELLRQHLPDAAHIGFFLHIPFPKAITFGRLSQADALLKGLSGADLIGFHTKEYATNFMSTWQKKGFGQATDTGLTYGKRTIRVRDFPIGIDYDKFAAANKLPEVKQAVRTIRRRYRGLRLIAAVDRLDISKGFVERLIAYRTYLERHPKERGKICFVLVGAPSRTDIPAYVRLAHRVDKLVAEINAQFGTPRWQPVDYVHEAIPFEEVTALFEVADVAFVAPLRDGMNLVAKEFIASQHRKGGVLILSKSAGAAEELHDAVLVNHKHPETLVEALETALHMSRREKRTRLQKMQKQLASNTIQSWAGGFMSVLQQPLIPTPGLVKRTQKITPNITEKIVTAYRSAEHRQLLLDYDGTLLPLSGNYRDSAPSATLLKILGSLTRDPKNTVIISSGRSRADLDKWFHDLPLTLIAEHGSYSKPVGQPTWTAHNQAITTWKEVVLPLLEEYAALTPGASVEQKTNSLVWHYRQASPYYAQKNIVILRRLLKPVITKYRLKLYTGNKILEIRDPRFSKGTALQQWLHEYPMFRLAIGDDYTDEDVFSILPDTAYSVKVGPGRSAARYRVADYHGVRALLQRCIDTTKSSQTR